MASYATIIGIKVHCNACEKKIPRREETTDVEKVVRLLGSDPSASIISGQRGGFSIGDGREAEYSY